jgi:hypothetical protein
MAQLKEASIDVEVRPLRLYDRSRVTTDWGCPRKRFYNYEFAGKGIVPPGLALELFLGTVIHDAFAALATSHLVNAGHIDIDLIVDVAKKAIFTTFPNDTPEEGYFALEQAALIEGILRGFHLHVWPSLIERYPTILFIEEEMLYTHNNLGFMAKPDLVLTNDEGEVVYVEYKSTSSKKEGWVNSWSTAVQLHSTIRAVEASKGVKVSNVIIQGLYKGYESYGKQSSPFCYAYMKKGQPPFSADVISYEYRAGLKRYPTWELEGGTKKWIEEMPSNVLADQFPQTPPIMIKDDLVNSFFAQRTMREHEIKLALDMLDAAALANDEEGMNSIMDTAFPQRFDQCIPGWGKPCGYRQLCHGGVDDPFSAGFSWREPHHTPEVEAWAKKEVSNDY